MMPIEHKVKQGECISSIAEKFGLFPDTIWNDPDNSELKEKRKESNVLYSGDTVVVPDKRIKEESCATEQRHRFRRKGVPETFFIYLLEDDEPRANETYILDIDGKLVSGTTDFEGKVEEFIPPSAKRARLLIGDEQDECLIHLGHLDPIDLTSGVQARLNNLGFDCGAIDGVLGLKTEEALKRFQKSYALAESRKIDQQTKDKLKEIYGM